MLLQTLSQISPFAEVPMRKVCSFIFALAFTAGSLAAAPVPEKKDPTKEDQEKIQGTWTIESIEDGGRAPDGVGKLKLAFTGDKCKVMVGDETRKEHTFKLDATAKLRSIDLRSGEKLVHGIYKLDGDTLTICMDESGEKRPEEFAAKKETRTTLVVLKRVKP
jgi:uncharacterized protein (TIGR03067 family)